MLLKFIWQLPQNIVALIYLLIICRKVKFDERVDDVWIFNSGSNLGSVSLGNFVFLGNYRSDLTQRHELGHCKQSMYLGPLYLFVIGVPSIIWASYYYKTPHSYYSFYTEVWADKLAGIDRLLY